MGFTMLRPIRGYLVRELNRDVMRNKTLFCNAFLFTSLILKKKEFDYCLAINNKSNNPKIFTRTNMILIKNAQQQ